MQIRLLQAGRKLQTNIGRRHVHKKKPTIKYYRINQNIRVPNVKLIDAKNSFVGIIPTSEALRRAQEQGADLVEVSPKEDPPVVKILDFGRFKYGLEKKKQKSKAKKVDTKGIRLALNVATHDLEVKIKQTQKFLSQGNKAQLEMILKGRQMAHVRRAHDQMDEIIKKLAESAELIQPISQKGRRITALLQPKK